jgi:hypothetical protein
MRTRFTEGDGPYDKEVAKRLYESVLAWEILIKKMLRSFRDVTPRVMPHESKRF